MSRTKKSTKKKSPKLIPLTIQREKWSRGGKNGQACLLNDQGTMCCLGFACRTLGVTPAKISGLGEPQDVVQEYSRRREGAKRLGAMVVPTEDGYYANSQPVENAIGVNDNDAITDAKRELKLKPILRKLGFEVQFVGDRNKLTVK